MRKTRITPYVAEGNCASVCVFVSGMRKNKSGDEKNSTFPSSNTKPHVTHAKGVV